jgi:hypothetical protein
MASVIAIKSEVFGSWDGEVDISVGMENRSAWLCCGWKYQRFILAGKVPQYLQWKWAMVPGMGGLLRLGLSLVRQ